MISTLFPVVVDDERFVSGPPPAVVVIPLPGAAAVTAAYVTLTKGFAVL